MAETSTDNLRRLAQVAVAAVAAGGRVQTADALAGSAFSIHALLVSGERVSIETEVTIAGATVSVCSLQDLRAMKRALGARVTSLTSRTWTPHWVRSERVLTAGRRRTRATVLRTRRRGGLRGPRGGG